MRGTEKKRRKERESVSIRLTERGEGESETKREREHFGRGCPLQHFLLKVFSRLDDTDTFEWTTSSTKGDFHSYWIASLQWNSDRDTTYDLFSNSDKLHQCSNGPWKEVSSFWLYKICSEVFPTNQNKVAYYLGPVLPPSTVGYSSELVA